MNFATGSIAGRLNGVQRARLSPEDAAAVDAAADEIARLRAGIEALANKAETNAFGDEPYVLVSGLRALVAGEAGKGEQR